ncbi:MAG: hypothetical protein WKG01_28900 [Kofleriaceae bacterium]
MVYRDSRDPRIEPLKQVLAREPALIARRGQIRRAHDALQERADVLGREVAELERGGIVATITNWLGRSASHDKLAAITAELATRVAEERAVDADLAEVAAARAELATLEAQRLLALRAMPGGLGDQLRALDDELTARTTSIAALREILIAGERAQTLVDLVIELKLRGGLDLDPDRVPPDDDVMRGEILRALATLDAIRARHSLWRNDSSFDATRTELATIARTTDDLFVTQARRAMKLITQLQRVASDDLREHQQQHAALTERQHELLEQS